MYTNLPPPLIGKIQTAVSILVYRASLVFSNSSNLCVQCIYDTCTLYSMCKSIFYETASTRLSSYLFHPIMTHRRCFKTDFSTIPQWGLFSNGFLSVCWLFFYSNSLTSHRHSYNSAISCKPFLQCLILLFTLWLCAQGISLLTVHYVLYACIVATRHFFNSTHISVGSLPGLYRCKVKFRSGLYRCEVRIDLRCGSTLAQVCPMWGVRIDLRCRSTTAQNC
jgi:hypothetical protein